MRNKLTQILSICIVLLVAVIIQSFGTLALTDLGTYDNSPKRQKEVINANNTLTETAVNANLGLATPQFGATVTTSAFTARYVGDILVDTADADVWIASGATSTNWVKLD